MYNQWVKSISLHNLAQKVSLPTTWVSPTCLWNHDLRLLILNLYDRKQIISHEKLTSYLENIGILLRIKAYIFWKYIIISYFISYTKRILAYVGNKNKKIHKTEENLKKLFAKVAKLRNVTNCKNLISEASKLLNEKLKYVAREWQEFLTDFLVSLLVE